MLTYYIHITYNTPSLPPINFAEELSHNFLGTIVMRRINWKQWLCKILFGEGCVPFTQITLVGWVYYGQCENRELKSRESALMDTGTPHKLKDYFEKDNDYFINAFYKRWQISR